MNGVERVAIPKEKVKCYKHTYSYGIHFYTRGHIGYMVDMNNACILEKFDYRFHRYLDVTYDDFHKFVDIKVKEV